MKPSIKILVTLLLLLLGGLLYSNVALKQEYDKIDKSDNYWTYGKILDQPFKHLVIKGGNLTHIAFEPSPKYSVRVLRDWQGYHDGRVKAYTKNDTLFVDFSGPAQNLYEKFWMRNMVLVRIFAPELLSVDGYNTTFEMFKVKQENFRVRLSGRSTFEAESLISHLDSLDIVQKDSSEVVFEMSPEFQPGQVTGGKQQLTAADTAYPRLLVTTPGQPEIKSKESMEIAYVNSRIQGHSLLDIGHAQVGTLKLDIADSSAIILSGSALRKSH